MKAVIQKTITVILVSCLSVCANASSQTVDSLDQLLNDIKRSRQKDTHDNERREAKFILQKTQQEALLVQAQEKLEKLQRYSEELEQKFDTNQRLIRENKRLRQQRMGNLQELFGHLTVSAGKFRGMLQTSIVTAQYPGRADVLDHLIAKMEHATLLPKVSDIEGLWYEILREMTESAKVVAFNAEVVLPDGRSEARQVIRIGSFNLVSEDKYLGYQDGSSIVELVRQPSSRFTNQLSHLKSNNNGFSQIGVDPTGPSGGAYLAALIDTPNLTERWHQGGVIGYIITVIGAVALLVIMWRLVALTATQARFSKQLKTEFNKNNKQQSNALGRLMEVAEENPGLDADVLEIKLTEAILREKPAIERFLPLLKIIAMAAPLLGLLGTVAGMIMTFQAITIYGAGDPKAMAGGISSALVTTVLGLLVAIPAVFAHALLNGKSKNILHMLELQGMGLIAGRDAHSDKPVE